MTAPTKVFNSPAWTYDPTAALQQAAAAAGASRRPLAPHHPETWKVSVWQVRPCAAHSLLAGCSECCPTPLHSTSRPAAVPS